jgi:hypothetical protein
MEKECNVPIEELRGKALWRELHRETVQCPDCAATMSRRTLRWKHRCAPRVVDVGALRSAIERRSIEAFRSRVDARGVSGIEKGSDAVGGAVHEPRVSKT